MPQGQRGHGKAPRTTPVVGTLPGGQVRRRQDAVPALKLLSLEERTRRSLTEMWTGMSQKEEQQMTRLRDVTRFDASGNCARGLERSLEGGVWGALPASGRVSSGWWAVPRGLDFYPEENRKLLRSSNREKIFLETVWRMESQQVMDWHIASGWSVWPRGRSRSHGRSLLRLSHKRHCTVLLSLGSLSGPLWGGPRGGA